MDTNAPQRADSLTVCVHGTDDQQPRRRRAPRRPRVVERSSFARSTGASNIPSDRWRKRASPPPRGSPGRRRWRASWCRSGGRSHVCSCRTGCSWPARSLPWRCVRARVTLYSRARVPPSPTPHRRLYTRRPEPELCTDAPRWAPPAQTPIGISLLTGEGSRGAQARRRRWLLAVAVVTWQLARPRRQQREQHRFALVRKVVECHCYASGERKQTAATASIPPHSSHSPPSHALAGTRSAKARSYISTPGAWRKGRRCGRSEDSETIHLRRSCRTSAPPRFSLLTPRSSCRLGRRADGGCDARTRARVVRGGVMGLVRGQLPRRASEAEGEPSPPEATATRRLGRVGVRRARWAGQQSGKGGGGDAACELADAARAGGMAHRPPCGAGRTHHRRGGWAQTPPPVDTCTKLPAPSSLSLPLCSLLLLTTTLTSGGDAQLCSPTP